MTTDARQDTGAAAYRGFLFADLRGFTAFAERFGNAAAAERVARFLDIARAAITRYEGAEIKTEGDAIHAVFPSASSAVLCGLDIVDTAEALNAADEDAALDLGVGIHAGEAVETAEGYIGTAVNIAARLCAAAMPGEVLVTATVKGITQASIPVGFIDRGRRRLKGIREPVEVFAATRDLTAGASRTAPGSMVLVPAVIGITVVAVIALILGSQLVGTPVASPAPTSAGPTAPAEQPLAIGPLPIGSYRSQTFEPSLAFDIVDLGWTANRDTTGFLSLIREGAPRGSVSFLRVNEVIANPCIEGGDEDQVGPTGVLASLAALEHLIVSEQQALTIGGRPGQQIDVVVSEGAQAACGGLVGTGVGVFRAGTEVWRAQSGERFRVVVVPVDGQDVTIVLATEWTETPSVQELEALLELGSRIVGSARFAPA